VSRLPIIDSKKMEEVLLRLGFAMVRQKGSHVFYRHPDVREILREIDCTPERFRHELKNL